MAETDNTNEAGADVQALIDQGLQAAEEDNYEDAVELFGQAVDADPDNARARYNLALAQQNVGDPEGAIATYLRAIQIDPNLIEAYINLGHLYGELGLDEEAAETFKRAIELDAGNDDLFVALGDAYSELEFFEDAIQVYRQAEILNPDNVNAQDNLRDVRERVREQAERITELERQLDANPRSIERYAEVIGAYLQGHRYQDALTLVNQMVDLFPDDPVVYQTMALVQEELDDIDSAAAAWEKVTLIDPDDADAWEHLATWRIEQGVMDEAVTAYRKALDLDPSSVVAQFNLAATLLEAGEFAEATALYRQLVESKHLGPNADDLRAEAYVGLAEAQNGAEQFADALETSDKVLADFPDESLALYQKATALDGLGRDDEAVDVYVAALENDPLNADIYNDLADTYIKLSDFESAVEMAKMATAIAPEMDVAYETLAQALHGAGRDDEAAEAEKKAQSLQQEPDGEEESGA
jgi:tetratricopeptide (TPR) repeat protein